MAKEIVFRDIPEKKDFKVYFATQFKKEDGMGSMAFAERLEICMEATRIANDDTRKELRELMEETMEKAKKIIATHENKTPR